MVSCRTDWLLGSNPGSGIAMVDCQEILLLIFAPDCDATRNVLLGEQDKS